MIRWLILVVLVVQFGCVPRVPVVRVPRVPVRPPAPKVTPPPRLVAPPTRVQTPPVRPKAPEREGVHVHVPHLHPPVKTDEEKRSR